MNFRLSAVGIVTLFSFIVNTSPSAYARSHSAKTGNQKTAQKEDQEPDAEYVSSLEAELATPPADSLLMAIFLNDATRFKELMNQGQDVNATDGWGIKLLNHAAALGETEIMQMIIDTQVNIDAQSGSHSSTAAHSAAQFGQLDSIKLLVQCKADLSIANSEGKTAGQIAEEYEFRDIVEYLKSVEANQSDEHPPLN